MIRKIIEIDEEKCNGCGLCIISCAEGALAIVDGKAKLISDKYCDGLGACLKECPQGALKIIEREAEEFDEKAVEAHLHQKEEVLPCGCPSSTVRSFEPCSVPERDYEEEVQVKSELIHWPVQLTLVPPNAPFFQGRELVVAAHCAPVAYPSFHRDFLKNRAVVIACPKLDDFRAHLEKLASIFRVSNIKKVIIAHMEVPCCFGLNHMVNSALEKSGVKIPVEDVTIGVKGEIIN